MVLTLKNNGSYHLFFTDQAFCGITDNPSNRDGRLVELKTTNSDIDMKDGGQGIAPGAELKFDFTLFFPEEIDLTTFKCDFKATVVTDQMVIEILKSVLPANNSVDKLATLTTYTIEERVFYTTQKPADGASQRSLDEMK